MNFTEEARKLHRDSYGMTVPATVDRIAASLQSAYERGREKERERCAVLIVENAIQNTGNGRKELVPRDDGNQDGLFYAEAIRNQP